MLDKDFFLEALRYLVEIVLMLKLKGDFGSMRQEQNIFILFSWFSRDIRLGALIKENGNGGAKKYRRYLYDNFCLLNLYVH